MTYGAGPNTICWCSNNFITHGPLSTWVMFVNMSSMCANSNGCKERIFDSAIFLLCFIGTFVGLVVLLRVEIFAISWIWTLAKVIPLNRTFRSLAKNWFESTDKWSIFVWKSENFPRSWKFIPPKVVPMKFIESSRIWEQLNWMIECLKFVGLLKIIYEWYGSRYNISFILYLFLCIFIFVLNFQNLYSKRMDCMWILYKNIIHGTYLRHSVKIEKILTIHKLQELMWKFIILYVYVFIIICWCSTYFSWCHSKH